MYIPMYFAALFILYETYRIVDAKKLSSIMNGLIRARRGNEENWETAGGISFKDLAVLAALDCAYFTFTVILLFTAWWYVGAAIIAFSTLHRTVRKSTEGFYDPVTLRFDSIFSIGMLSLIILL